MRGEPYKSVVIRVWQVDPTVEVDDCGDAAELGDGRGDGWVPREDVGSREEIEPCHQIGDASKYFNG